MIRARQDHIDADLLAFVRSWLNLLAAGKLDEACQLLDEPSSYGHRWTPNSIRRVVDDTFSEGVFTVVEESDPPCRSDVFRLDDGSGYSVDHDVPLNGAASDLTAQCEFRRRNDRYAAVLQDLHVL